MGVFIVLLALAGCGRIAFDERDAAVDAAGDTTALDYPSLVQSDNPVAYWRLGDSTAVAVDEMGSYDGTYSGNYSQAQSGATRDDDTAVRFNDTSITTNMTVTDSPALRLPGTKTLELWYHPNGNVGTSTFPNLISKGIFSSGYLLYYLPSTDLISFRENSTMEVNTTNVGMNTTAWNHVVFVYDASDTSNTLYVNNVRFDLPTYDWGINTDTDVFAIGTIRSTSQGTTGSVDEVAIYDHALTSAQVAAHYQTAMMEH